MFESVYALNWMGLLVTGRVLIASLSGAHTRERGELRMEEEVGRVCFYKKGILSCDKKLPLEPPPDQHTYCGDLTSDVFTSDYTTSSLLAITSYY